MKSAIQIETPDFDGILGGLSLLMLPPARKRRFLARQARMVIAQAKKNIADQKTITGSPMEPRERKPPEKRAVHHRSGKITYKKTHDEMFFDLVKSKWLWVEMASDDMARVGFRRNSGYVADRHQYGKRERVKTIRYVRAFDSSKVPTYLNEKGFTCPNGNPGCTANQAARLIRLDYIPRHLRGKVPGGGTEAVKFLMQNVGRGIAAFLIREGMKKRGTTEGGIKNPARPFLGAGNEQRKAWATALLRDIYGSFKAKNYIGLLK